MERNFISKFHFFRLSDYGQTKLINLLAAIPSTVRVIVNENGEKVVQLIEISKNVLVTKQGPLLNEQVSGATSLCQKVN